MATAAVFAHLAVVVVHGLAHQGLKVQLSGAASLFVLLVILIGPLAGFLVLRSGRQRAGAWTLGLTMAAAFLFGLWNHFLAAGTDHAAHVPEGLWKGPFQVTAWLLLATEGWGSVVGFLLLRALRLKTP